MNHLRKLLKDTHVLQVPPPESDLPGLQWGPDTSSFQKLLRYPNALQHCHLKLKLSLAFYDDYVLKHFTGHTFHYKDEQ